MADPQPTTERSHLPAGAQTHDPSAMYAVPPFPPAAPPPSPPAPPADSAKSPVHRAATLAVAVLIGLVMYRWSADRWGVAPLDQIREPGRRIDLNRADRAELMQLPGVGPATADAILQHRRANGAFLKAEDIRQVKGIGPATWKKLEPWVSASAVAPHAPATDEPDLLTRKKSDPPVQGKTPTDKQKPAGKVNVNTADKETLETLPGIGPVYAQRIIDARSKQPFSAVSDLRRVSGLGPKRIEALKDLVTFGDE